MSSTGKPENYKRPDKQFYLQGTPEVARMVLGKYLWRKTPDGYLCGKITETEAYLFTNDAACHSHKGKNKRNAMMFENGGVAYVYLIYGFYYCFNIVTEPEGIGEAVLVRAVEPVYGLEIMQKYRDVKKLKELTSGPGKLCLAMNIGKNENGLDLIAGEELFITEGPDEIQDSDIVTTTRIGITKAVDLPLRFYLKDNLFISKK